MGANYQIIDMSSFPRKEHFNYFRSLANPYVGVTVEVDVTDLVEFCRRHKASFYLTFMHVAAISADEVPEFRQRIKENGIVEYDRCGTSHVEGLPDGTYCYCSLNHGMLFNDYILYAEQQRKNCREKTEKLAEDEDVESMYFISSIPWLHYSDFTQPTAGGDESNPRISWGKYEQDFRGRLMMPVTALCNHGLVDGIHLAKFYENINKNIDLLLQGKI